MEIQLKKYDILSPGHPINIPEKGEGVRLLVRKREIDSEIKPSVETVFNVMHVLRLGSYVQLSGNTIIEGNRLTGNATYNVGVNLESDALIGELVTKVVVEDN